MPHINRIRVNNIKYNFGTQFYDDFTMRFDGKNALYDLANGGGKSVLMLLLFQNLIPNCTLDEKQPVEKLFRTNDGSTTIHSLVEWRLDGEEIDDGYKYMLTGFCARRAKTDEGGEAHKNSAAIDYFNYVIFYRGYNDNDIINLPLSKGRERMTYTGLRSYLKELEHKDYQLKIRIFDRKGEYQRFISRFGLYESQWEIIRGINKTEGHVRTYFESNYKTARKVVEDLLIEEIIQKAFANKAGGDTDMAQTLLDIKDKLLELSAKKDEISCYDSQCQALLSFQGRIKSLGSLYDEEDAYKKDLVRTLNTILHGIRQKQKEMAFFRKDGEVAGKRLSETSRKLDTAKVQKNRELLRSMEADTDAAGGRLEALKKERAGKLYELSRALSANDFLELKENEKEAAAIRQAIENSSRGSSEMLAELKALAGLGKAFIDGQTKELTQKAEALFKQQRLCRQNSSKLQEELKEAEKSAAVLEFEIKENRRLQKQSADTLADLRKQINALLIEGTAYELKEYGQRLEKLKAEEEACQKTKEEAEEKLKEYAELSSRLKNDEAALLVRQEAVNEFLSQYASKKAEAERLLSIYGAENTAGLKQLIAGRYQRAAADLYTSGKEKEALSVYAAQLKEKNPVVTTAEVKQVMAYLRRQHKLGCISGNDYLKDIDSGKKQEMLERLPFLPYAVIVTDSFGTVLKDEAFKEKYFGDFTIPVISIQAVESDEKRLTDEQMLFTGCHKELYLDDEALLKEIEKTENDIAEIDRKIKRLEDQEETYLSDLEQIHYFTRHFEDIYISRLSAQDSLNRQLNELRQKYAECEEMTAKAKAAASEAGTALEDIGRRIEEAKGDYQLIEQMVKVNKEIEALKRREEDSRTLHQSALSQAGKAQERLQALLNEDNMCESGLKGLNEKLDSVQSMWLNDFSVYYDEKQTAPSFGGETLFDVHSRFMGMRQAYEEKSSDLGDKRKLLENYEKAAKRLKADIEARNIKTSELEAENEKTGLAKTDSRKLKTMKEAAERISDEIKLQEAVCQDSLANRHKLTGRVENAIQVIEERYGFYKEVDLKNRDYDTFFYEYGQNLKALQEKAGQTKAAYAKAEKELNKLEEVRKDVERLMSILGAKPSLTDESLKADTDCVKKSAQLLASYEQFRKNEDFKKSEFEKDKEKLIETLKEAKAQELADEVKYHVSLPEESGEAVKLMEHIGETVRIIMLEKERVLRGIENMEQMKENFVRQCVQRCTDVKMELERLPGMSKITLDNEKIQMLKLKIPYVREELYHQKMAEYIDYAAMMADSYKDSGERLKFIRSKLALKQLFSVIVTDMNAVRLSLYKRERIKEQSRFLRYEEAVGSTGQSQGIYIQFLIAVINYISAINSRNTEQTALKKVIFIDNPFGAAKDIYIWEPIFELLKENNVQLIVPARGATPAITGKFDVNYILGQKLINDRQQTVVVDYYSNIAIEDVEYKKIEFEQEVFDFV